MGHTLARVTVFFVSASFLLYSLFVATVTFLKLNFTVSHVSEPLRIGYGVILVILAPSGLWGIIGSTQNNSDLCDRYLREHWFSSGVFTIIDGIKVALSFTMKIDSINACVTPTDSSQDAIDGCRRKVDFNQIASLIIFGAQEYFLIFLGILVWYSCKRIKRITKKINEKGKEEALERLDLSEVIPDESNVASMNAYDLREQRQNLPLDRINDQPTSTHVPRRPSQYNKGRNDRQTIQIKPEPMPNVLRSREFQGDNYDDNNNVQGMRRYDQKITAPPRPRKSYNRQNTTSIELQRELSASQSMNSMATTGRSKSMRMAAPLARSNNNVLHPQFQPMQQIKYPQGARNKVPPAPYFSRTPLPQFQAPPNFQPPHPWQQQWQQQQQNNNNRQGVNDGPDPPEGTPFRTHRRSRSHPQLRPLPDPPTSDNFTVQPDHSVPPQIHQRQAPPPQIIENEPIDESKDASDNSQKMSKAANRLSNSSRYKPSLSPVFENRSPKHSSLLNRSNSLPNLNDPEDLMRNESTLAPPVPLIPAGLYPDNNNKSKVSKSQPSKINLSSADKLARFIDAYGNKDYNRKPENLQYNYSDNHNGWNTHENDDYVFDHRRPKSAHSVGGEARPKSSVSSIFGEDSYYSNHYYYEPSSNYENQGAMNNQTYHQNLGPITPAEYNNGGKFVQKYPTEGDNYNRQGSQKNYYY